jgi:hypothetical protein
MYRTRRSQATRLADSEVMMREVLVLLLRKHSECYVIVRRVRCVLIGLLVQLVPNIIQMA